MSTLNRIKMKTKIINFIVAIFIIGFIVGGIIFMKSVVESATGGSYRELIYPEYYQLQEQKKLNKNLEKIVNDTTNKK